MLITQHNESMMTVVITDGITYAQTWDAEHRVTIARGYAKFDYSEDTTIDDVAVSILEAIDTMKAEPSSLTDTIVMINSPVRNGIPTHDMFNARRESIQSQLALLLNREVTLTSTSDMLAIELWERTGYELLDQPGQQLNWARSSRVVTLNLSQDLADISIVNNGRVIDGIGVPCDCYPWHNIMTHYMPLQQDSAITRGYYEYLLNVTVRDFIIPMYSPDIITITCAESFQPQSKSTEFDFLTGKEMVKSAAHGALYWWIKHRIGWRPLFITDDIDDDDDTVLVIDEGSSNTHDFDEYISHDNNGDDIEYTPMPIPSAVLRHVEYQKNHKHHTDEETQEATIPDNTEPTPFIDDEHVVAFGDANDDNDEDTMFITFTDDELEDGEPTDNEEDSQDNDTETEDSQSESTLVDNSDNDNTEGTNDDRENLRGDTQDSSNTVTTSEPDNEPYPGVTGNTDEDEPQED